MPGRFDRSTWHQLVEFVVTSTKFSTLLSRNADFTSDWYGESAYLVCERSRACDEQVGDVERSSENHPLWSHRCSWDQLLAPPPGDGWRGQLDLDEGWQRRWTVTWRDRGDEVRHSLEEFVQGPLSGLGPMRWFAWRRDQRHRPGLPFMVSTGRLHGSESLEEAKLLLALDFAGDVLEVVSQPFRIGYGCATGQRDHTPDFLVMTKTEVWLIDVRPAELIKEKDRESFAASEELARICGWRFMAVSGWLPHVMVTVDCISSRRRTLTDPLGVEPELLAEAAKGRTFGELARSSEFPPVARAQLLHMLWHRRLGVNLREPLSDRSVVVAGGGGS